MKILKRLTENKPSDFIRTRTNLLRQLDGQRVVNGSLNVVVSSSAWPRVGA